MYLKDKIFMNKSKLFSIIQKKNYIEFLYVFVFSEFKKKKKLQNLYFLSISKQSRSKIKKIKPKILKKLTKKTIN